MVLHVALAFRAFLGSDAAFGSPLRTGLLCDRIKKWHPYLVGCYHFLHETCATSEELQILPAQAHLMVFLLLAQNSWHKLCTQTCQFQVLFQQAVNTRP